MSYLLLVVETGAERRDRPPAQGREAMAQMQAYAADLQARGKLLACEALKSDASAVRLRRQQQRIVRLDGPFAESKEMIGGFFLLNCSTLDEALALAEQCPAINWAMVEVREVGVCYE